MSNAELQAYLAGYPGKEDVSILLASPKERKMYKCDGLMVITDQKIPVICIELVEICEECERSNEILEGQMNINDYPGVVPLEVKHD